ncbi:MAG: hypothetical protein D6766_12025 [Verrucomicrobia bacterium]|nr:MAG: hypothetical protein D6766_12025 [Verrucomicrobiota bacterium]
MSLGGARARLVALTRDLKARWEWTRTVWSDARAAEFEKQFLEPLWSEVQRTAADLENLDRLLRQIEADCE